MKPIGELRLFQRLIEREVEDGLEAGELSSRVREILLESQPILAHVVRFFPEYTLHDAGHGERVVENMVKIMPAEVFQGLNSVELSVLLYSGYLHDIGMASNEDEFHAWLDTAQASEFISSDERIDATIRRADLDGDETLRRKCEDIAYTRFLRDGHAKRGSSYAIDKHGPDAASSQRIELRGINYSHLVATAIESHGENADHLHDAAYYRDTLVQECPVNLQFACVLLRLADLIDLDPERTPRALRDFLDPLNETSADEWRKHRSVQGWDVTSEHIRFEARCSHPAIQRGLHQWMETIDEERRQCLGVLADNRAEITERYRLDLAEPVVADRIKSDGSYVYGDFRFEIDYERIVSLVMGTQLWRNSDVALRELLQNAFDTCGHRQELCERGGMPFSADIQVELHYAEGARRLVCSDNGMGMDTRLVKDYFMRIGRSYYQSTEFRDQGLNFNPISQFGLGIMSTFMLADKITIETMHLGTDLKTIDSPLQIEIDGPNRYFVVRPGTRASPGTAISLDLRAGENSEYLRRRIISLLPHPRYPVNLLLGVR